MTDDQFQIIVQELKGINGRLDKIDERLDKLEERMDRLEARMDHIEARMDKNDERMDSIEDRMNHLEITMDMSYKALNAKLDQFIMEMREFRAKNNLEHYNFLILINELRDDVKCPKEDLRTLYILSKANQEEHAIYNEILNVKPIIK